MRNILELTRVLLKERLRSKSVNIGASAERKGSGYIAFWIVLAVVFIPMLAMIAIAAFSLGEALSSAENSVVLFTDAISALISFGQVAILLVGVPAIINTVYQGNDAKMLLALPFKSTEIFTAKLLCAYVFELGTSVLVSLFVLLPTGLGYGANAWFYLGLIPEILLMPVLPMLIATILGFPIMFVSSKLKNKGIVTILIMCVGFAALIFAYYYVIYGMNSSLDGMSSDEILQAFTGTIVKVGEFMFPNLVMARMMAAAGIGDFLLNFVFTVLIDGGVLAINIAIASGFFGKILSGGSESSQVSSGKREMGYGSLTLELIKRDFKSITRNAAMGFNCFMSVFLSVIFPLVLLIEGEGEEGIQAIGEFYGFIPFIIVSFMASSNVVASGAFTREGEGVALMKALPIAPNEIIRAKLLLAFAVDVVSVVLGMVVSAVILQVNALHIVCGIITALVLRFFGCALAIYVDLKKPRLVWRTPAEGFKNSPASIAAILVSFLCLILSAVTAFISSMFFASSTMLFFLLSYGLTAVVMAIASVIMVKKLKKDGARLYYALSEQL